ITLDASQKHLITSNYVGNVSIHRMSENGTISNSYQVLEFPRIEKTNNRQDAPHLHMSLQIPGTDIHLFSDLGSNKLWHYELSEKSARHLSDTELMPGAGPRHMILSLDGQYLYVLNELNHTIEVFRARSFSNSLERLQSISVKPKDLNSAEITSAAIQLHPSGKFLYTSTRSRINQDENFISVMEIDHDSGMLRNIQIKKTGGFVPRDFVLSPDGKYLLCAHQDSDNIITFSIELETGMIENKVSEVIVNTPVCLKLF
ncbi:MAG: lactonase family protein, partial [Bacteroidia bacterium]|nr:lactonase family protein [Bacteroidia bacterium]